MKMGKQARIDEIRECLRPAVLRGSPFELSLVQHPDDALVIAYRPAAVLTGECQLQSVAYRNRGRKCFGNRSHEMPHLAPSSLLARGGARQVNSILTGQHIVDRFMLQTRGDEETHEIRNHEGDNYGVVLRRFKDHQYRSHRGPDDAGKKSSHANQGICSCRGGVLWQQVVCNSPDSAAQHCSDEKAGPEDSTCITGSVAGGNRKELQDDQEGHDSESHSPVQCVSYIAVADAQNLWNKKGHQADEHASDRRL